MSKVGEGTYGTVYKAVHKLSGQKVAIKAIELKAQGSKEGHQHLLMIAREIYILCRLSVMEHNNFTVKLLDIDVNPEAWSDASALSTIYLVSDYMPCDLYSLMQSKNEIEFDQVVVIAYNLLLSLNFIHSAGVLHRDLAPKNVLLNNHCQVFLCDFGWSRTIEIDDQQNKDKRKRPLSPCFGTRYYRAPEGLVNCKKYDYSTDIWSYGCVIAELVRYVFMTKSDDDNDCAVLFKGDFCSINSPLTSERDIKAATSDQLQLIVESLG